MLFFFQKKKSSESCEDFFVLKKIRTVQCNREQESEQENWKYTKSGVIESGEKCNRKGKRHDNKKPNLKALKQQH